MLRAKIISVQNQEVDVISDGVKLTVPGVWSADLVIIDTNLSFEEMTTLYQNETEFELMPDD